MVLGTGSHVGKSLITAALCRIFAQEGYSVAPFKSQNMSLNSAATIEGLEIGRAQALQAEAAGTPPSVDMNPILLKPSGQMSSQIILRGKVWGQLSASDYHQRRVEEFMPVVRDSFEALTLRHDIVIIEGAGSPAEINLKDNDIVNMRIAAMADASCLLIGDIDRGGVFASLLGTIELLDRDEQDRIGGFVINKFRGNQELLDPGIRTIEQRLAKRCLGVVPYIDNLLLEEEDSLGLSFTDAATPAWSNTADGDRALRIAVVALPSFSNFTDFDALRSEPSVDLRLCRRPHELSHADVIILPGSKQTVDDLTWLRREGFERELLRFADSGLIVGICGGMQMLGRTIFDPEEMESNGTALGLNLLPFDTMMHSQKVTNLTTGRLSGNILFEQEVPDVQIKGYEIHLGQTTYLPSAAPFARLARRHLESEAAPHEDGCMAANTRVFGTYLHGIFDEDEFRHAFLLAARAFHKLSADVTLENFKQKREQSFDRLANTVRASLDMHEIFSWAGLSYKGKHPPTPQDSSL
jgi:adenosylcobyric acid synthase